MERYLKDTKDFCIEETNSRDVVVAGEVGTTLGSEKPIELVGAKKISMQQTLQSIENVSLSGCQIVALGGEGLKRLAPKVMELDLSRNLLSKWSDVITIIRELPLLKSLILSGNRFLIDEPVDMIEDSCVFENLKVLVLNQTMLPWKNVQTIVTRHFPKLEELHVADNEYSDEELVEITLSGECLMALSVLDLSLNCLTSWKQIVCSVGAMFPNLSQLILNGNRIVTLVTDETETHSAFQKLTMLSLSDNLVDSWTSIDALNAYPLLVKFRFSKNPLTKHMSLGEARMLVIARTERIAVFNGSLVRDRERMEAEQLYLKRILHELAVMNNNASECERVLAIHPRFSRLRELYSDISIDSSGNFGGGGSTIGPQKLASSLIKVIIIPMSMQATSFEPLVKKISQQMKVSELKFLIEAKCGIETSAQVLSFRNDARSMPMLLDDDSAEVNYYGVQDGSEILVNDNEHL
ncbi:Uncharacterized conserved protein [Plasmopara halstedii]|uniref:Uncharacterized conserved protein n=1 Tax=Plasmopara halstedii TaxID=4781 RepID=A0A0P1AP22_PLAHL|nr:Uncharacterized conserved protein [Plasmopara halstedii]CEG43261.1 Uncharacterized conserved protein [Plasmopara halstedii]|eukprot:XP_024579630.1 Uncharacterized conserved protein [Plasmopara halstedii]